MGEYTRPQRQPDLILGLWEFFFDEMVQWHASECKNYKIRVNTNIETILWLNPMYEKWFSYEEHGSEIYRAYLNWQIESILLEQV